MLKIQVVRLKIKNIIFCTWQTWSCQFFVDLCYSSFAILFILWEFSQCMTLDATVHLPNFMKFYAKNVLYKFEMIGNYIFCKFFQHFDVLSLFNFYQSFTISCLINNHLGILSVRNKKDNIPFRAYQQAMSRIGGSNWFHLEAEKYINTINKVSFQYDWINNWYFNWFIVYHFFKIKRNFLANFQIMTQFFLIVIILHSCSQKCFISRTLTYFNYHHVYLSICAFQFVYFW